MSIKNAILSYIDYPYLCRSIMAKVFKDHPCEHCGKLCKKRMFKAFCSDQCRLIGQSKKEGDCLIWQGVVKQDGYGVCGLNGKTQRAHRVSYQIFKGCIDNGLLVLHSCHKPLCIEPNHLRLGTVQENAKDTIQADHQRKGETVGTSKLKKDQVLEIRRLYEIGMSQSKIASMFSIHQTLVGFIVRRVRWKHI